MQTKTKGTVTSVQMNSGYGPMGPRLIVSGTVAINTEKSAQSFGGAFSIDVEDSPEARKELHLGREVTITIEPV